MRSPTARRLAAGASAVTGALGAAGLLVASGSAGTLGYVSEAGVPGAPYAGTYRVGIWLVAVAVALLAVSVRPTAGSAALALAAAAPMAVVSGAVTCTAGCPLPPYERGTAGDLLHAAASIAALSLCGLAVVLVALRAGDRPVRRTARLGAAVVLPLLAACGAALLLAGRAPVTGLVERLALAALLAWLVATACLLSRRDAGRAGRVRG